MLKRQAGLFRFRVAVSLLGLVATGSGCVGSAATDGSEVAPSPLRSEFPPKDAWKHDPDLVGSWSIGVPRSARPPLRVPEIPFRSVAAITLRSDGTFFAQVAPRIARAKILVDVQLGGPNGPEVAGFWEGLSGYWTVVHGAGGRRLVLGGEANPEVAPLSIVASFEVKRSGTELSLTDPTYPGSQLGGADVLRLREKDCRLTRVASTPEELTIDAMEATIVGIGERGAAGPPQRPEAALHPQGDMERRCDRKVRESEERLVWRDGASHKVRASEHRYSVESPVAAVSASQRYVYDERGQLRLIVTTRETSYFPPVDKTAIPLGLEVTQSRTYFDSKGNPVRTLIVPYLEEARTPPEVRELFGRRYVSLEEPLQIADMPRCLGAAPEPWIAKNPRDASASIAAEPHCADTAGR